MCRHVLYPFAPRGLSDDDEMRTPQSLVSQYVSSNITQISPSIIFYVSLGYTLYTNKIARAANWSI